MLRRLVAVPTFIALLAGMLAAAPAAQVDASPLRIKPAMGVAANNLTAFNALDAVAPMTVRRSYDGALPSSFAKSAAGSDVAKNRISYWSFKPNAKTFATDKAAQTAFAAFLKTIPQGHRTVIILWHEPEDNIAAGDFTLAQWGAMTTRAGQLIDATGRPELRLGICFMGPWTFDSRSRYYAYNWESVLDMRVVDIVGIDPYKFRTKVGSLQQVLTVPNYGAGGKVPSTMQRLVAMKRPIALMEWGITTKDVETGAAMSDAERAKWVSDGYAWMKSWNEKNLVRIEAAIYFHLVHNGHTVALQDTTLTAWKAAQADSRR